MAKKSKDDRRKSGKSAPRADTSPTGKKKKPSSPAPAHTPDDPEGLFDEFVADGAATVDESAESTHGLRDLANRTIQSLLALTSRDDATSDENVETASEPTIDGASPIEPGFDTDDLDSGPVTSELPIITFASAGVSKRAQPARRTVGMIAKVVDEPDAMLTLVNRLAEHDAEIRTVFGIPNADNASRLEIVVSAPAAMTDDELMALLADVTTDIRIRPWANPRVEDTITGILDLATAVVSHPELLDDMLVALTTSQSAEHTTALSGADDSRTVMRVQVAPDEHIVLSRPWAPFEQIDRQRVSALLRLAAAAQRARGDTMAGRLIPVKGGEKLWFRLARPEDSLRLAAMHERSSQESLYLRYHGAADLGDVQLRRLSGGHRGATLVAMNRDGLLVAAGHVFPLEDELAEIAILVEDDYQGRGVGTVLVDQLLGLALDLGFTTVRADVIGDNRVMLHVLEKSGLEWQRTIENGVIELTAPLSPWLFD